MTTKLTAAQLKKEMHFTKKLARWQVERWLRDYSYEMGVVMYAQAWASQTGRFGTMEDAKLRNMTPSEFIAAAVAVQNSISYFSTDEAKNAWRKQLNPA